MAHNINKIGVVSLGCTKNRVDSEVMMAYLQQAGYHITPDQDEAELIIVNTCGFIESAKKEAIETILEMAEKKKDKCRKLIVTGCLAKRYATDLMRDMPEIDGILGVYDYASVVECVDAVSNNKRYQKTVGDAQYLDEADRMLSTASYTAYLKIAEGCDNRCAYCAIPSIRGSYVSRSMESLLREAKRLADGGVRELILIAQDTTRYGEDLYGRSRLIELMTELSKIEGIHWLRLMYCYPDKVSEDLFRFIADNPKVCKYMDLPIQHVNDRLLTMMNRRGGSESIMRAIGWAEQYDIVLRTSLIVGFPTETLEEFDELCEFIEEHPMQNVGVFAFSAEEGTPAAELVDYDAELKEERLDRIMRIQQSISKKLREKWIGKTLEVMIETQDETGFYIGRSQYEAPDIDGEIYVSSARELQAGEFVQVKINQASEYDLMGEAI